MRLSPNYNSCLVTVLDAALAVLFYYQNKNTVKAAERKKLDIFLDDILSWLSIFRNVKQLFFSLLSLCKVSAAGPNHRNRISVPLDRGYQGNCGKGVVLNLANTSLEYYRLFFFFKEVE